MFSSASITGSIVDVPKRKILIADDDPDVLRLFRFIFQKAGYEVVTAVTGTEALNKARSEKPDLLVLDVMMPEIDGLEVCWRLRDIPETAHLPILMASAKGQVPDRVSGLHAGADDYIVKPVSTDELLARVAALLSRVRRAAALRYKADRNKVIGFIGCKGGVGVTTAVLNFAALLAQQKKSVIAVELQPNYGTFALQLKWHGGENLRHLLAREPNQISEKAVSARLQAISPWLRILYGPQSIEDFGNLDAERVGVILEKLTLLADFVLLDLPPGVSDANRAAAQICDLVVAVMEFEPTCVQSMQTTLRILQSWDVLGGLVGALLVNRSGLPGGMSLRDMNAQLNCEIVGVVPFAGEIIAGAVAQGLPLVAVRPDHAITAAFREMVNRLAADTLVGIRV